MATTPSHQLPSPLELLAPAGTLSAFAAALAEGADAVYIGAPGLNARALARDFTFGEIAAMTEHAHGTGKKVYVAMNSLMKEAEVPGALETLYKLNTIGPDALIIQDMGILHLVRRFFPSLRVHASTLMTVNNSMAARYLKDLGFERIVLARELSLEEIRTIHDRSEVPLEIFIHGAMCFSYSGLCRFSSLHGGKSSLRGQCVQPCRRRYDWLPSGKRQSGSHGSRGGGYFFSMNDLSGLELLAEVRAAGVVSLKIEGRLKSVAYVRNTVRAYRLALSALDASPEVRGGMLDEARRCLDAAMGRKRSSGFLVPGREDRLILPRLSGSSGEVVGKVTRMEDVKDKRPERTLKLQVTLQAEVRLGDRLRLYEEKGDERKSFTLRSLQVHGKNVDRAHKGQTVIITLTDIEPRSFRHPSHGVLFRVDVSERTEKNLTPLLRRASQMQVPSPGAAHVGKMLTALAMGTETTARTDNRSSNERKTGRMGRSQRQTSRCQWWLRVASLESVGMHYPFPVAKVVLDLNKRNAEHFLQGRQRTSRRFPSLVWALPPILLEEQLPWYRETVGQLRQQGADSFQISHIGQAALFAGGGSEQSEETVQLYGDYSCNVLNSPALRMYAACGLSGVQFSLETDRSTLAAAIAHCPPAATPDGKPMQVGLLVYGRPPLFSARLDAPHFQGQRTFVSSRGERFYLDRREETLYAFSPAAFSLLAHVEELSHLGVDYLVVDVRHGQPKRECAEVTALLSGRGALPPVFSGNYAGTLA